MTLSTIYRQPLALLTDLYQLTMAYGYWKTGLSEREAAYHLFFRRHPFAGEYCVASGLQPALEFLQRFRFDDDDLEYLAGLKGNNDERLLPDDFLDHLLKLRFTCNVDAIPEGTVVFAHEPLLRVRGPILQCQLVETALLAIVNFHSLIATKASRICRAAQGDPVLDFGLRRAQGIDGGISASRAAIIGGCVATSNVLAGRLFNVPIRGTHAHSWVMALDDELQAFRAYAAAMPNNCLFLVDTYDTLEGVRRAVQVGKELRQQGYALNGIRLDSGDLTQLSIGARRILDEHGFHKTSIVASNELDEYEIDRLKKQGAAIDEWGVGTRLATAYDEPALGGVYKLSAIQSAEGQWQHRVKRSDHNVKVSNPGIIQVRRFRRGERYVGDILYDELTGLSPESDHVDLESGRLEGVKTNVKWDDLVVPVLQNGQAVHHAPSVIDIQSRTRQQLACLDDKITAIEGASRYPLGVEKRLHDLKKDLLAKCSGSRQEQPF